MIRSAPHRVFGSASVTAIASLAALGGTIAILSMSNGIGVNTSSLPAFPATSPRPDNTRTLREPTPTRLLAEVGITVETVAAAGCSTEEAVAIARAARSALNGQATRFAEMQSAFRSAAQRLVLAEDAARACTATQEQRRSLDALRLEANQTKSQLDTARDQLFATATAQISDVKRSTLASIRRARRLGWSLPPAYLVVVRTEAEMIALRDALAESRFTASRGEKCTDASQALITSADQAVHAAGCRHANAEFLDLLRSAWRSALQ